VRIAAAAKGRGTGRHRIGAAVLGLALFLAPATLSAQGPPFLRDSLTVGDPIAILLQRRAELRLSAPQVRQLEDIQHRLGEANGPLVTELVEIRRQVQAAGPADPPSMTPEQRAGFRRLVDRARPLVQTIGRNNLQAMEEVGGVLTPDQRALVRGWLASAPARGARGQMKGQGARGGGGRGRGPRR
jgi:hypothetical protein